MKKIVSFLLCFVMILILLPNFVFAASAGLYSANKADVPVWSEPSSSSTKIRTLSKGTLISIVSTTINAANNEWGKTANGTWIYMGNLDKSNKPLPATGLYITIKADVPLRKIPASAAKIEKTLGNNVLVTITSTFYNDVGNEWGNTSDGYVIYMGNIEKHTHKAVMCGVGSTKYEQNNDTTHKKIVDDGGELCSCGAVVVAPKISTTTENHTFSNGKCTKCGAIEKHTHNAVMCGAGSTKYEQVNDTTHKKIIDDGEELCSCGAVVVAPKISTTTENHTFSNGKCTKCGAIEKHTHKAVMCGVGSTKYEQNNDVNHKKIVDDGGELCSCGAVVVAPKISTTTENHTFSNGICTKCGAIEKHTHKAVMCGTGFTKYEQYNDATHKKIVDDGGELCSCGVVVVAPKISTELENHTFSNGKCTKCNAWTPYNFGLSPSKPISIELSEKRIDLPIEEQIKIRAIFDRNKDHSDFITIISSNGNMATAKLENGYLIITAKEDSLRVGEVTISVITSLVGYGKPSNVHEVKVNITPPIGKNYFQTELSKNINICYYYDDSLFIQPATTYIPELAEYASILASQAYKKPAVKKMLEDNYNNIKQNNYTWNPDNPHTVGYTIASGNKNGNDIVIVAIRGTEGGEWYSNFDIYKDANTPSDLHYGFSEAADNVFKELINHISLNSKVFITGHSRGAAVANILAGKLVKEYKIDENNVYAYTFATPNVSTKADTSMKNIYNFINTDDFVTQIPLKDGWGYDKNGQTKKYSFSVHDKENKRNEIMKKEYLALTGKSFESQTKGAVDSLVKNVKGLVSGPGKYYSNECVAYYDKVNIDLGNNTYPSYTDLLNFGIYASLYEYFMNGVAVVMSKDSGAYLNSDTYSGTKLGRRGESLLVNSAFDDYGSISRFFIFKEYFSPKITANHCPETYIAWVRAYNKTR